MVNRGDKVAKGMSEAGTGQPVLEAEHYDQPHQGDRFRCDKCGMEVEVKSDCHCHDTPEHFHCCGAAMHKV